MVQPPDAIGAPDLAGDCPARYGRARRLRATLDQLGGRADGPRSQAARGAGEPGGPETAVDGESTVEGGLGAIVRDEEQGVEPAVAKDGSGSAGDEGGGAPERRGDAGAGVGLQPDLDEVERIANEDAERTAEVAGPEVGGHFTRRPALNPRRGR